MFDSRKGNRDSRTDFERELNILGENIMGGKIVISSHLRHLENEIMKESLNFFQKSWNIFEKSCKNKRVTP